MPERGNDGQGLPALPARRSQIQNLCKSGPGKSVDEQKGVVLALARNVFRWTLNTLRLRLLSALRCDPLRRRREALLRRDKRKKGPGPTRQMRTQPATRRCRL